VIEGESHFRLTQGTALYGPVRTVVWQGSAGDRRPYSNLTRNSEVVPDRLSGSTTSPELRISRAHFKANIILLSPACEGSELYTNQGCTVSLVFPCFGPDAGSIRPPLYPRAERQGTGKTKCIPSFDPIDN